MSTSSLLTVILIVLVIIFVMLVGLMLRVRRLEDKGTDISASDVAAYVDNMREILIESERLAETLDTSIKEREAVLEDLSDLVEARINRLHKIAAYENSPTIENLPLGDNALQSKVYSMLLAGDSPDDIARALGITVADVDRIIDLAAE